MDDEEIRKLWLEIQDAQKHPDVEGSAIRLYRMAFQEGMNCPTHKGENMMYCAKCYDMDIEQARADEREELIAELKRIMKLNGSWKAIKEFVKKKED